MDSGRTRRKRWRIGMAAGAAALALVVCGAPPAGAATTLTVNSVEDSDDGVCAPSTPLTDCTLREAISAANLAPGVDTIGFDIAGTAPHTIRPLTALPDLYDAVVLDGTTEPDFAGSPVVQLLGQTTDSSSGFDGIRLMAMARGSTVRGLTLGHFAYAVSVMGGGGHRIEGNHIGVDPTGTRAQRNIVGISVASSSDNVIGGTAAGAGNLISGNIFGITTGVIREGSPLNSGLRIEGNRIGTDARGSSALGNTQTGLQLTGVQGLAVGGTAAGAGNVISGNGQGLVVSGASSLSIRGNLIGTGSDASTPLGNAGIGVGVFGPAEGQNLIGGAGGPGANTIAFNGSNGVQIQTDPGSPVSILSNRIHANGSSGWGLGIDLAQDRGLVAPNDPGDVDEGPNGFQNHPVVTSVDSDGGTTVVRGTLDSRPSSTYVVQLFSSSSCNPSGHGEGERFLGEVSATTDADGSATFSATVATSVPAGHVVTATATDAAGNTSEFSACADEDERPVADAGADQTVDWGSPFLLDGSGSSDPEGEPLTFLWEQVGGPEVVIEDPRSARTRVPGAAGPATLTYRLTVTDAAGATAVDEVSVIVRPK